MFVIVIHEKEAAITQCYRVEMAKNIVFFSLPRARARFIGNIPIF